MKVRKYNARTSRDALRQVREDLGPDAVILANRLVKGGVEVMAMAASELAPAPAIPVATAPAPLEVGESDVVAAPILPPARRSAVRRAWAGLGLDIGEPARAEARPAIPEPSVDALFEPLPASSQLRREPAPAAAVAAHVQPQIQVALPLPPVTAPDATLAVAAEEPVVLEHALVAEPAPVLAAAVAASAPVPAAVAVAAPAAVTAPAAVAASAAVAEPVLVVATEAPRRVGVLGLRPEPAPLDLPTAGTGSGAPAVLRRRQLWRGEVGDRAWFEAAILPSVATEAPAAEAAALPPVVVLAASGETRGSLPAEPAAALAPTLPATPELAALAAQNDPLMSALAEEVRSLGSMLGRPAIVAAASQPHAPAVARVEASESPRPEGGGEWMRNMMGELRSMRSLIEDQIDAIAAPDGARMPPGKAGIVRLLSTAGFSAALIRKLTARLPADMPEDEALVFLRAALRNNLSVAGSEAELLDQGGVCALVGPTGAGKTTTAAKLAARFVVRHGAENLALLTTDGYRIGGQEQLRIYGRILGVAVHAVKDTEDLRRTLGELRNRKLVLIDTVGLSQRDGMVNDQHQMFARCGVPVRRLLLLNATCHADTLADVGRAYRGDGLGGCILTKLDEAAAPGAALDAAIRQRLRLYYTADGQRVPEDLQLADASALVERVLDGVSELELARRDEADFPFEVPPAAIHAGQGKAIGKSEALNG